MIIQKPTIYMIIDIATCYDRQLLNIESLIVELVGINRKIVILIAKVHLILQYYMCIRFGISTQSYRSWNDKYARTYQGNIFSRKANKIKLCRIIKALESKEIRFKIENPITK